MNFPNFLRLAAIPLRRPVRINATTVVEEEIFDYREQVFARLVSQKLGFSYETVTASDERWGSLQPDGNWSGMIGLLQRNEADLIIFELSATEERRKVIDFSYPYHMEQMLFATRRLEPAIDDDSFLKPFTIDVWICVWACVFLMPALYSILFQRDLSCAHFRNTFKSFLRPSNNAPKETAEFFLRTCHLLFEALLGWSYASVLLSFLTSPSLSGVRNIQELANAIRQGKYMCTTYPGSDYERLLVSEDPNYRIIGQSLKESGGHRDFAEVLSNTKLSKKASYLGPDTMFTGIESKYFVSKDGIVSDNIAIGIRKGFCCKAQLDRFINEVWASGIYDKIIEDYARKKLHAVLWKSENESKERSLSLADFQGVFIVLAAGYSLAIAAFLCELILWKVTNAKKAR